MESAGSENSINLVMRVTPGFSMDQLSADPAVLEIMLTQLSPALRNVVASADALLSGADGVDFQREQALLLSYSGICVSFLWSKKNAAASSDLRYLLAAPEDEPKWLRDMRNTFIHMDERLVEIFERTPQPPLTIWSTGAPDKTRMSLFGFDIETETMYSMDRNGNYVSGSLRDLRNLFAEMERKANGWSMFFLFGGPGLLEAN